MKNFLERKFKLSQNSTTAKREIYAGLTTFLAMSYSLFVNPTIISQGNQEIFDGVFFATCISAGLTTLLMAIWSNLPFALSAGMGLNGFFAFTIMPSVALLVGNPELDLVSQYQMALVVVMLSGLLFLSISSSPLREKIIDCIPKNLKIAISSGIGLFVCFIGLQQAGLVVANENTLLSLANLSDLSSGGSPILSFAGFLLLIVLIAKKVTGSTIITIIVVTILSYITGVSKIDEGFTFEMNSQFSNFLEVSFLKLDPVLLFSRKNFLECFLLLFSVVISFTMADLFDSIGTFIGIAENTKTENLLKKKDSDHIKKALNSDAIGSIIAALTGTSTVTTYVESTAGVAIGGRTGLCSCVTGILFLFSMFFAPFIALVPSCATAPALIYVGFWMMSNMRKINYVDLSEGVPAFLTIVMMPLSYSIANGIALGLISFVVIKVFLGRSEDVSSMTWVIAGLFLMQYVVPF